MTRALLIVLVAATAAIAQAPNNRSSKPAAPGSPNKKPEASSSADFRPSELAKLAVIVTAAGNRPGMGGQNSTDSHRLVEDAFLECLLAKGYVLAARSDVDAILREKKFQESGATEELAARVGKVLNVPAVLLVRVTDLSSDRQNQTGRASLGARLVNVENGTILWTGNHTVSSPTSRSRAGAVLLVTATALAEVFPDKPQTAGAQIRPINPEAVPKLAVLTVDGSGRPSGLSSKQPTPQSDRDRSVEDVFVQVMVQKGYNLVARTDLQAVMKEQAFQKSGLTEDNAVAAGKLLNVPAVLLVGVTSSTSDTATGVPRGRTAVLSQAAVGARLVDVASGEMRWVHAEYKAKVVANAGDLLAEVAKDVVQFLPPEPDSAHGLLGQARLLETMGQLSAAKRSYRELTERHADTAEGKKAADRLKALGH